MMTKRDPYVNMLRSDHRGRRRGPGRRRRDHGAAVHAGARPARSLRAPHRAQHAADPARGIQSREGRGPQRGLRRHRGADRTALQRRVDASSRRSNRPAARGQRSSRALIQKRVAAVRDERDAAVARRKDALTGTSDFPDLAEAPVAVLDVAAAAPPSIATRCGESSRCRASASPNRSNSCATPPTACSRATGARPKIFLANLGKPSDFTARATFAKNFFEAGGIEAVSKRVLRRRFSEPRSPRRDPRSRRCSPPRCRRPRRRSWRRSRAR